MKKYALRMGVILWMLIPCSLAIASPISLNLRSLYESLLLDSALESPTYRLDSNWGWTGDSMGVGYDYVNGLLTINTPTNFALLSDSFYLEPPTDWGSNVSNSIGWIVKAELQVTSADPDGWEPNIGMWINDYRYLTQIGFEPNMVFMYLPNGEALIANMDTTDKLHAYRVEGQDQVVQLFVDDNPIAALTYTYQPGEESGGTDALLDFGDLNYARASNSSWASFSYDTRPEPTPPSAIPEPGSMLLLSSGLAGLIWMQVRKPRL